MGGVVKNGRKMQAMGKEVQTGKWAAGKRSAWPEDERDGENGPSHEEEGGRQENRQAENRQRKSTRLDARRGSSVDQRRHRRRKPSGKRNGRMRGTHARAPYAGQQGGELGEAPQAKGAPGRRWKRRIRARRRRVGAEATDGRRRRRLGGPREPAGSRRIKQEAALRGGGGGLGHEGRHHLGAQWVASGSRERGRRGPRMAGTADAFAQAERRGVAVGHRPSGERQQLQPRPPSYAAHGPGRH